MCVCKMCQPINLTGVVTEIEVLGCGIVAWRTPANTGNEEPGYAIRFFDGDSYDDSSYREIQRFFDDPSVHWARAKNMPSTRPIYADVSILTCTARLFSLKSGDCLSASICFALHFYMYMYVYMYT